MNKSATTDETATKAVTVHGRTRLRNGLLDRFSLALITSDRFMKRIHACHEPAQTGYGLDGLPRTYTLIDEQGCGKSWHDQALAVISRRSSFRYKPRRVRPSSRAAREMFPLCLFKAA